MIRFLDFIFSLLGIILLFPVFLVLYFAVRLESKGGGFYKQLRVGRGGTDFYVYKFRSMRIGADKQGLITVGGRDPRITQVRPGITDYASIEYVDENTILGQADDADKAYVERILPDKIQYNMKYINHRSVKEYFKIIFLTIWSIIH